MFRIEDTAGQWTCAGLGRREFLQVGGLALCGLTLPGLLATRAATTKAGKYVKDRSVILVFLQGGPSHIEFFDPKMSAPDNVRSITGELKTKLPGITFGGNFHKLAARANRFSVVRSYASMNGGHKYDAVTTAKNKLNASMSALYARLAGTTNPRTGMPSNVLIKPEAIDPTLKLKNNFETGALPTLTQTGTLGPAYAAFDPSGGSALLDNLKLRLSAERFGDRKALLAQLDTFKRRVEKTRELDTASELEQRAFDVLVKGIAEAFDLKKEDAKTIAKYDTSHCFKAEDINKWHDMKRASNLLGKQLLLARRLVEAGAGFVTVSDCGWDMHANKNSPAKMAAMPQMAGQVDHAVSALLDDLKERGLEDRVLVVVTGEMGRTPRLNKNGGRDHWANLTALLLAGGGIKPGQVIGASDNMASKPATTRYTPENLLATIMQSVFDAGELRITAEAPKNVAQLVTDGKPIEGLT
jgi:uncharacterized protein (DUF1501 family)